MYSISTSYPNLNDRNICKSEDCYPLTHIRRKIIVSEDLLKSQ